MIFKASLDKISWVITYILLPILVIFCITTLYLALKKNPGSLSIPVSLILSFVVFGSIFLISYLFSPTQYEIKLDSLYITRPIGSIEIPLSSIKDIYPVAQDDMKFNIRTFGNGGLFGYYGYFYNRKQGKMTWYATQKRNYVILLTNTDKKIVLTPDDLSLVEAVKNY
ncbi:MAG TPA: PH domain-containing protein [Saprospiraceae bacterium]|nr:PH domain-containing protein [Saprospiraceae bacterium]